MFLLLCERCDSYFLFVALSTFFFFWPFLLFEIFFFIYTIALRF
jgi:hypothetical protein